MVRTLLVVGTGLIGTSVALAARRHGVTVFLEDGDPAAARIAESLGAGVAHLPRQPVDLAVLAVPPAAVGATLRDAQTRGYAHSYTDVASVKAEPERDVMRLAPDPESYVGGHPMAGRERSGPLAASADLFAGRTWVLTPSARTGSAALDRATRLVTLCGGVPLRLDSRAHDTAVALTSHLPHLMASLTAARLRDGPDGTERLTGRGARDVTRIAAGDPALWTDIVRSNAPAVAAVLRDVRADLTRLLVALEMLAGPGPADRAGAERAVTDLLERGVAGVSRTREDEPGGAGGARLAVVVGRRPGDLARLLRAAAVHGVVADGVTAGLNEGGDLVAHLAVPTDAAADAAAGLGARGWTVTIEDRHSQLSPTRF